MNGKLRKTACFAVAAIQAAQALEADCRFKIPGKDGEKITVTVTDDTTYTTNVRNCAIGTWYDPILVDNCDDRNFRAYLDPFSYWRNYDGGNITFGPYAAGTTASTVLANNWSVMI